MPTSRLTRILRAPLCWLVIGVIAVGAPSSLVGAGPLLGLLGAALAVLAYRAVMRYVAHRPTPELTGPQQGRKILTGAGIGAAFLVLSVGGITLLGGYRFTTNGAEGASVVAGIIAIAVATAVTEELMFRGLGFQAFEQLWGPRAALMITAALFGAIHLANPGSSVWSALAVAIEAGLLMGAAFWWSRSLWLVIALHATWNGLEQLLGIPVSGHTEPSLIRTIPDGPAILTGGEFGMEASIVPVLVSLALTAAFLRAKKHESAPAPSLPVP